MQQRRSPRVLARGLAVLASLVGCYVGLFTATFARWFQDIDGPVPVTGRLMLTAIGLGILAPSLALALGCYRRRPRSAPAEPSSS